MKLQSNIKGEASEYLFISKCMMIGYNVSKPTSSASTYDVILERDNVFERIQVKSGNAIYFKGNKNITSWYIIRLRKKHINLYRYTIDYLVVHIVPVDAWYKIPISEIKYVAIQLAPHRAKSKGKYEKYRIFVP